MVISTIQTVHVYSSSFYDLMNNSPFLSVSFLCVIFFQLMRRNAMPCGRKKKKLCKPQRVYDWNKIVVTSALQLQERQKSSSASALMLVTDAAKWTVIHVCRVPSTADTRYSIVGFARSTTVK